MIKAIIVDDERRARNILRILIEKHLPEITNIIEADGGIEGLRLIQKYQPDLVFLDVEMPFMNGFDLLAEISKQHFSIIFTTAYDQYAIKAIRYSALDYLLKPIDPNELKMAFQRFWEQRENNKDQDELYQNFLENLENTENQTPKLAITTKENTVFFKMENIIRCEASNNYTFFYLKNGKKFLASKTLKEYDAILSDHHFFRVHKSHLVNLHFIKELANDGTLTLQDGSQVEVSRRKKQMLRERLQ
ncbi:MAG: LytR/AlgR family response regulator transcription factor [Saprospiraceae bacterium]